MRALRAAAGILSIIVATSADPLGAQGVLDRLGGVPGAPSAEGRQAAQLGCKPLEPALEMRGIPSWSALNILPDDPPARDDLIDAALRRLGGMRLVLEIDRADLRKSMLMEARDHTHRLVRDLRLGVVTVRSDAIEFRPRAGVDAAAVSKAFAPLTSGPVPLLVSRTIDDERAANGFLAFAVSDQALEERLRYAEKTSLIELERRISVLGSEPPRLQVMGDGRILAVVPGLKSSDRLFDVIIEHAQLTFRPVEHSVDPCARAQATPPDAERLTRRNTDETVAVQRVVIASAQDVVAASVVQGAVGTDQAAVALRFNSYSYVSARLAKFTESNVGKALVVILHGDPIHTAVIREPIVDGAILFSGSMSLQEARNFAALLKSASLSSRLTVVEQQVIPPGPR